MNVLIAGSTGLVGSHTLKLLLESPKVQQVISVARKSLTPHPKLEQIVITFSALESEQLPQADVALCALGTTIKAAGSQLAFQTVDHDYVLTFAKAAKRAGAKKFVVISALGADENSRVFYNRVKGETERDLKALNFESLIILQPSLLIGERNERRPAERLAILLAPVVKQLLIGPLKQYTPVDAKRVAQVMVNAALDGQKGLRTLVNSQIIGF